ncbi:uncharacterized protein LOC133195036 [Saccostrea echinata]|uniref:uncharacterized protein LOC133195036 n=1 Tax=Saccostrea echinata TaxID=191078 RepID=UPI002A7F63E7|nr:uncharacterized protein LOC133195036 [Saccostrea echinata]
MSDLVVILTENICSNFKRLLRSKELLTAEDRTLLSTFIGKSSSFELLYKISRDGCSASKFHQSCDYKGPTVTVLYNTENSVYGGFLAGDWKEGNSSTSIADKRAFLFTLHFNGVSKPRKYSVIKPYHAAFAFREFGPTFGAGDLRDIAETKGFANERKKMSSFRKREMQNYRYDDTTVDLLTFYGTVEPIVDRYAGTHFYELNGKADFRHAYDGGNESMNAINNGHMCVFDLEVYKVKDVTVAKSSLCQNPSDKTWRESPCWDEQTFRKLKDSVSNYKPLDDSGLSEVNILLVGQIGAGKSSFFNTVNSIFRGEVTARACAGNSQHSLTTVFRKYRIRNPETGGYLNFRLCDTRGIEEDMCIKHQDMASLLDGHLPDQHKFNPAAHATEKDPGFKIKPTFKDKIHCVAFVMDSSSIDVLQGSTSQKLAEFHSLMIERGIPQTVYLTKLDKICPLVDDDVRRIFNSEACKQAVNKAAEVIGLPRSHVFPVKNYEKETQLQIPVDILALSALRQTLVYADDYLEDQFELSQTEEQLQLLKLEDPNYHIFFYSKVVN